MSSSKPVEIRRVFASNLHEEFSRIRKLTSEYRFISMDTEFPGNVYRPPDGVHTGSLTPSENYSFLKRNVNELHLIQVGLALSDSCGSVPDLLWEFNLSDFNVSKDRHDPQSIEMLKKQGIDFQKTLEFGISSFHFAELLMSSGLVCDENITWITFHGAYDFGYLIKLLTCKNLPDELGDFLKLLRVFFGEKVYDVKHISKSCHNLYGGLEKVALILGVERVVGKCHEAGSDSLLTLHVWRKIKDVYPCGHEERLKKCAGVLYGLEVLCWVVASMLFFLCRSL